MDSPSFCIKGCTYCLLIEFKEDFTESSQRRPHKGILYYPEEQLGIEKQIDDTLSVQSCFELQVH